MLTKFPSLPEVKRLEPVSGQSVGLDVLFVDERERLAEPPVEQEERLVARHARVEHGAVGAPETLTRLDGRANI